MFTILFVMGMVTAMLPGVKTGASLLVGGWVFDAWRAKKALEDAMPSLKEGINPAQVKYLLEHGVTQEGELRTRQQLKGIFTGKYVKWEHTWFLTRLEWQSFEFMWTQRDAEDWYEWEALIGWLESTSDQRLLHKGPEFLDNDKMEWNEIVRRIQEREAKNL